MKTNKIIKVLFCLVLFASPIIANADDIDDANGTGDVNDTAAAPIDDYIPVALIAAAGLGYMLLRKKVVKI